MSLTASDVQTEIYLIPKNAKDISGIRFGRLVAILPTRNQNGKFAWLCRCDCGKPTVVVSGNLRNGNTTSCGCFHMEQLVLQHTTHGRSRQVTYRKWATIIQRCTNPKVQNYARYGGAVLGCVMSGNNPLSLSTITSVVFLILAKQDLRLIALTTMVTMNQGMFGGLLLLSKIAISARASLLPTTEELSISWIGPMNWELAMGHSEADFATGGV